MDQDKNTEKNNGENNKEKKVKSSFIVAKIVFGLVIFIIVIFSGITKITIERDKYKETITNLKFDYDIIRGMLVSSQLKLKQANQKIAELEINISKNPMSELTKSKPALTNWIFENSSNISKKIAGEIVDCVLETNFPLFLLALIKTESTFDPTSVSRKGALGLGQVLPRDYEKKLKEAGIITEMRDVFNIPAGAKSTEFAWNDKLVEAEGDIIKALALYLGENNEDYTNQILKDFLYLNYLCKKPEPSLGLSHTPLETNMPKEVTNDVSGSEDNRKTLQ